MTGAQRNRVPLALLVLLLACGSRVHAQLQITEIMYDTVANEGVWEWFEIRNAGSQDLDLDGYVFDDFGLTANARRSPNILSIESGGRSTNTVVAGGTVAVIYNGDRLEFDAARFRSAWNLPSSVPLIGVDGFQSLNNSGDAFGLWSSIDSYNLDLQNTDEDEALEVATFDESVAWIDYGGVNFPSAKNATIEWVGNGSFREGDNWLPTTAETLGVTTSVETLLPTSPLNSDSDIGNPGVVVGTGQPSSLVITELMYNPASSEPSEWEWIEVFNGSGQDIDFTATPYFLDDTAGNPLGEANMLTGAISDGQVAVLFRGSIGVEHMNAAWGEDINFIAVDSWPPLNNGGNGDTVGIWSSDVDYAFDSPVAGERLFDDAVTTVAYVDGGADDWPNVSNGQSISVNNLEEDLNDPTNWILSTTEDGVSRTPEIVFSSNLVDHAGGDLGTPGAFGDVVVRPATDLDLNGDGSINADDASLLCAAVANEGVGLNEFLAAGGRLAGDFDLNGQVEFSDFLTVASNFGRTEQHYGQGDANCNGEIAFADFLVVSANFGKVANAPAAETVPEPNGLPLMTVALGSLLLTPIRRRHPDRRGSLLAIEIPSRPGPRASMFERLANNMKLQPKTNRLLVCGRQAES